MNRVHRLVYSRARRAYVAAPETARNAVCVGGGGGATSRIVSLIGAALLGLAAAPALAEDVTYDGTNPGVLQTIVGAADSLGPTNAQGTKHSASASGNTITMAGDGGTALPGFVFGAYRNDDTPVTNNTVNISGGTVENGVTGGSSSAGAATGNTVRLSAGTVWALVGGSVATSSATAFASGNAVTISGGEVRNHVYGGYHFAGSGATTGNSVTMHSGTVGSGVHAGYSYIGSNDSVDGNTVTIHNGTVDGGVYGGSGISLNSAAINNAVVVNGGTIRAGVYGGRNAGMLLSGPVFISAAIANNNTATINGGTVDCVYGGSSRHGSANNNSVAIGGNAHVTEDVYGGTSGSGPATGNSVAIGGNAHVGGSVHGANSGSNLLASGNSVAISGGAIDGSVYGSKSRSGLADHNTVTISGGSINGNVYGGANFAPNPLIFGTPSEAPSGSANHNTVNIRGGEVGLNVFGGYAINAPASNNTVHIGGGRMRRDVLGGLSVWGNATGNTIQISATPSFDAGVTLWGGHCADASSCTSDVRTGNTLALHTTGIQVQNIRNFEYLHFYLQPNIANGATVLTTIEATDITGSKVGVAVEGGTSPLQAGHTVKLIDAQGGLTTDAGNLNNTVTGMQGVSLLYEFDLSRPDANTLLATVKQAPTVPTTPTTPATPPATPGAADTPAMPASSGARLNPQTQSLLEGQLAGVAALQQSADLAAGEGLRMAVQAAAVEPHWQFFGTAAGGKLRHQTGSHVDVKGAGLMLGASKALPNAAGVLTLGGFAETGYSDYDSYNDFPTRPAVRAEGHVQHYGLGIMAQQDFSNHWYVQGSLRTGTQRTSYHSADLANLAGQPAHYESRRRYNGVHVGAGHALPLGGDTLDVYGKLYANRYGSDTQSILGDVYRFDPIDSLRSQLGARYLHTLGAGSSVFGGLAWEYEHKGAARGDVYGINLLEPSLRGSTAVLEAGLRLQKGKLQLQAALQGHAGKRRGAVVNLRAKYVF